MSKAWATGGDMQQAVQDIIVQTPDVTVTIKDEPNYWWLLLLAVIPILLGYYLNSRNKND